MADKEQKQTITVTFTNKTVIRILIFVLVALLIVGFISRITTALQLILISGFLALALNPVVSWISNILPDKSRVRATAVAYIAVIAVLIGFIVIVVPPLVRQSIDFVDTIPISVSDIQNQDTPIVRFIERYNLTTQYTQTISEVKNNLDDITGRAYSVATTVGNGLVAIISVLVMTFMMLVEGPQWKRRFLALQAKNKLEKRSRVLKEMYGMVTGYVNGQLLIAMISAVFAFFALAIASTILQVSINPVAMAAIVGLFGLIPLIGNIISSVIVVLFCLFASVPLAIVMAIFFLVYQQVENATLQPYIQSKYNELTPLTVFVAAIIGVSVAGFLGALIAIPVAGCLRIYIKEYYGHKFNPVKED
jgi:predicted PurR-regulated permease PerM